MRLLLISVLLASTAHANGVDGLSSDAAVFARDPVAPLTAYLMAYLVDMFEPLHIAVESHKPTQNSAGDTLCGSNASLSPPAGATAVSHPSLTTSPPVSWLAVSARVNGAWQVYVTHRTPNSGDACSGWTNGWTMLPLPSAWGGVASAPAIQAWEDTGRIYLFVRDGENFLDYTWFDPAAQTWKPWSFNESAGGQVLSQPAVDLHFKTHEIHTFFTEPENRIGHLIAHMATDGSLTFVVLDAQPMPAQAYGGPQACQVGGTSIRFNAPVYLTCNQQVASYVPDSTAFGSASLTWVNHQDVNATVSEPFFVYRADWDGADSNLAVATNSEDNTRRYIVFHFAAPAFDQLLHFQIR